MSMLADIRRVTPDILAGLVEDPGDIFWFLHGFEPYEPPRGIVARLFAKRKPSLTRPEWNEPSADYLFSLDQSWHCVHFLLAGEAEGGPLPAAFLASGGSELGSVDVGYGPARAFSPEEVLDISRYLQSISQDDLRSRCDPELMENAEIYGAVRDRNELVDLWSLIEDMGQFLGSAANAGDGAIIYIY